MSSPVWLSCSLFYLGSNGASKYIYQPADRPDILIRKIFIDERKCSCEPQLTWPQIKAFFYSDLFSVAIEKTRFPDNLRIFGFFWPNFSYEFWIFLLQYISLLQSIIFNFEFSRFKASFDITLCLFYWSARLSDICELAGANNPSRTALLLFL